MPPISAQFPGYGLSAQVVGCHVWKTAVVGDLFVADQAFRFQARALFGEDSLQVFGRFVGMEVGNFVHF
jgi:hypothetical protein